MSATKHKKGCKYVPDLSQGSRDKIEFDRIRVFSNHLELRKEGSHLVAVMQGDLRMLSYYLNKYYIYVGAAHG